MILIQSARKNHISARAVAQVQRHDEWPRLDTGNSSVTRGSAGRARPWIGDVLSGRALNAAWLSFRSSVAAVA